MIDESSRIKSGDFMATPLIKISIPSIYEIGGERVPLPARMAKCTPDTKAAILATAEAVKARGGRLYLSDLFRSYDMQLGSHMDYVSKKKTAYSPPPGGSLHEAGRALDLDLDALKMPLKDFWKIAAANGLQPIIDKPDSSMSESWHFSCRGSHALVYDYYKKGKGTNFDKPYKAMAASAIVSVGVKVDKFEDGQVEAYVQSALIRLGSEIGNIDGQFGPKTDAALKQRGMQGLSKDAIGGAVDKLLQKQFPGEYFDKSTTSPPFA
jgi:hypothetical protein